MKTILIVDDEPDILEIVKFRLMKNGYDVHTASNGQEGWDLIKKINPDLVLLDYYMPFLSGDEVCLRVKNDPDLQRIPVILMTASSKKVEDEHIKKIKADGKILKPFDSEILLEKIKQLTG